ncbi:MAG: acetyl-CoA C-acetyltransferase [Polyangiaceae bacterium]|jgi:acetyl-CoA C-acetyltransferase/acetyl-CoA acyltransferase 2|nr:acetyl-CoA C-acetyltransferase [Polyangiaceae bacterium]
MLMAQKEIVIVAAKRTAFGALLGSLKGVSATDLAVHAARAALAQSGIKAEEIGHVVVGNVMQTSVDAIYCARHVGLKAGLPITTPAVTVNRLCGSGFEAVVQAAQLIQLGEAEAVLTGGTENMTQAPHVLRGAREGYAFGKAPGLEDSLWSALTDSYCNTPMAVTAENLAVKYGITREQADELALSSQKRWAAASESSRFADEIAPYDIVTKKGTTTVARDEHPRPQTTLETLAKLPPVFKKDGVVTAGNASGICDGAAMLIVTSAEFARSRGLTPLARIVAHGVAGVEPSLMGIGPAPAIRKTLERAGTSLDKIDLVEVNEAFAPQYIAVEKELGLDRAKTNVNGGAIALGHPLGASGARILAHLVYELRRRGQKLGVGSACIGGGQGIAVLLEAL